MPIPNPSLLLLQQHFYLVLVRAFFCKVDYEADIVANTKVQVARGGL